KSTRNSSVEDAGCRTVIRDRAGMSWLCIIRSAGLSLRPRQVPCELPTSGVFPVNFAGTKPAATTSAPVGAADLTVVGGGGHVGIPLVLAFAEAGYRVNVHDTNRAVLATLQSGRLPFVEYGGEALLAKALKQNRLIFTSSPAEISRTGPLIIT